MLTNVLSNYTNLSNLWSNLWLYIPLQGLSLEQSHQVLELCLTRDPSLMFDVLERISEDAPPPGPRVRAIPSCVCQRCREMALMNTTSTSWTSCCTACRTELCHQLFSWLVYGHHGSVYWWGKAEALAGIHEYMVVKRLQICSWPFEEIGQFPLLGWICSTHFNLSLVIQGQGTFFFTSNVVLNLTKLQRRPAAREFFFFCRRQ